MRIKYFYLLALTMIIASCHKDVDDDSTNTEEETQVTTPYVFQEIEGSIIGYVYGEDNKPIGDATVSIYSGSTTTNEHGVFYFDDIEMDGQGTLIKVTKESFFDGADFIFPNDNGSGSARIKLIRTVGFNSFDSNIGGAVGFDNDGLITFKANSIINQNGSTYTGAVDAYARGFYPNDLDFNDISSGSLLGIDSKGRSRSLAAYGSVMVTVQTSTGLPLQIKSQELFTIKFPIAHDQSNAPPSVIIWKYDESAGFWDEVGVATKEGDFYLIDVSGLGKYMFADAYPLVHFCARLVDNIDLPAKNYKFNIFINNKLTGMGISDDDGYICSKLPAGEELEIQITHPICGDVLVTKNIGPYSEPSNDGDLLIDSEHELRTGTVYCGGIPVSDALIIIRNEENTIVQTTNTDGVFNLNLDGIICGQAQNFEIFAVRGSDMSPLLEMNSTNTSDLMFEVCESDCGFEVSFMFGKEDFCTSGEYGFVSAVVTGGSGSFSYKWNDGGQEIISSSIAAGVESCVTVTDLSSGCIVEYCELVDTYTRLTSIESYSYNIICTQFGGVMTIEVAGGNEPFEYIWTGDNGYISNLHSPENVPPGTYQLIVSDANGCEIQDEIKVYDVTTPLVSEIVNFCDFSTIEIVDVEGYGPFKYSWIWDNGTAGTKSISVFEPGEYSVTVSDNNECIRTKSFQIVSVGSNFEFNPISSCVESDVYFDNLNPNYEYFYQNILTSEMFDLEENGGQVLVPILESGYIYEFGAQDLTIGCEERETITLPHFEGLQIQNVENTSCDTCTDGFISVFLDDNQGCSGGCVTGEVIIIDKMTGENVTSANEQSELSASTYYVIVTDENTGCYIAHEEVIVG